MTKRSLFATFVHDAAEHLADTVACRLEPVNRNHVRDIAVRVLLERAANTFGGERVYAAKSAPIDRQTRDARIVGAIAKREPLQTIAARERVSLRLVQKIRRRARTAGP
jgi:hypothetical protein